MSVDILLGQAGRIASPTRSLAPQQPNGQGKAAVDGQENSDPSQLFGALLEKPHGKPFTKGEDAETVQADEQDEQKSDASAQASSWAVSQNVLSLAANLPNLSSESHNSATENLAKKTGNAALSQVEGEDADAIEGKEAQVGADVAIDVKRKGETAQTAQNFASAANTKPSSKSGQTASAKATGAQQDTATEKPEADLADLLKGDKSAG